MSLYFCEEAMAESKKCGLPNDVFENTMSDIVAWTKAYEQEYHKLGLFEYSWISLGLKLRLHKLGRLEFMPAENEVEVHVPAGEPIDPNQCEESFRLAEQFFSKYYPDFLYDHYCIHSWLLDDTLARFLKPDSNILRFSDMFQKREKDENYSALRYVFGWNATKENLKSYIPKNHFMQGLYDYVLNDGKLYAVRGIRKREVK